MAAPKYMKAKAEQLAKAMATVEKLSNEIIDWVDSKGEDGYDFACNVRLDIPYEFDLSDVLEGLDQVADGEW